VGLPNVGKSTLFNALLKKQQAYVANFPFATVEPNVGVVPVPDKRLKQLSKTIKSSDNLESLPPLIPATVTFIDIAGLIKGAHKGEGLGNKFLSHIRETSVICHVLRDFTDENVIKEGSTNPKQDLAIIETELLMADLSTLEKQKSPGNTPDKDLQERWHVVTKLKDAVEKEIPAREVKLKDEEKKYAKELSLLSGKPVLVAINVDEEKLSDVSMNQFMKTSANELGIGVDHIVIVSAKMESELAGLDDAEQREYLADLGIRQSGLERLIEKAYKTLGLISFLTAGEKEVRAWTIKEGLTAQKAAGVIHGDFEANFVKADVCSFDDFVSLDGWKNAREKGKVRSEGRDYVVQEGDVIEFKVNV